LQLIEIHSIRPMNIFPYMKGISISNRVTMSRNVHSAQLVDGTSNTTYRYSDHFEVEVQNPKFPETKWFKCSLEDEGLIRGSRWYLNDDNYVVGRVGNKTRAFHTVAVTATKGTTIDHRDSDKLNNTRGNLRAVPKFVQNINKLGKSCKELPPGIVIRAAGSYVVSYPGPDTKTTTQTFSMSTCGRHGALKAAMTFRMSQLISDHAHLISNFPIADVNRAITEVDPTTPLIDQQVSAEGLALALKSLQKTGYNMWDIPFGGRFGHLMDKSDWSAKGTIGYATRTVTQIVTHLEAKCTNDELKTHCLEIEEIIRTMYEKYVGDEAPGVVPQEASSTMEAAPEALPRSVSHSRKASGSGGGSLASPVEHREMMPNIPKSSPSSTAEIATPSEEMLSHKPLSMSKAIEEARGEAPSARVSAVDEATRLKHEAAKNSINEGMAQFQQKMEEMVAVGNYEGANAMIHAGEKKAAAPEKKSGKVIGAKRNTHHTETADGWVRDHFRAKPGSCVITSLVYPIFERWLVAHHLPKTDGSQQFAAAVEAMGYRKIPNQVVYIDCEIVE
jgi:hypothetical protein